VFDIHDFQTDPGPVLSALLAKCVTTVLERPDLSVEVTDGTDWTNAGAAETVTVTVSNDGQIEAEGVGTTLALTGPLSITSVSDGGTFEAVTGGGFEVTWPAYALAAGATRQFEVGIGVDGAAQPADMLTYEASVADDGSRGADLTPANNTATDTTDVIGQPDLAVTVTDGVNELTVGERATVNVTVANTGQVDATGAVLRLGITGALRVISVSDGGSFVPLPGGGFEVSWPEFGVNVGAAPVARGLVVEVTDAAWPDDVLVYDASVVDDGASGPDLNPANNTASDTTVVIEQPDLTVAIDDGVDELRRSERVSVHVDCANAGRGDASGVAVSVAVTGPVTVTAGGGAGRVAALPGGGVEVSWPVFDHPVGERTNRTFEVEVRDDAEIGAEIAYEASVADDGARGADLTPSDNMARDTTQVIGQPDLAVTVTDGVDELKVGERATVNVTVTNSGQVGATGVTPRVNVTGAVRVVSVAGGGSSALAPGGGLDVSWPAFDVAVGASPVSRSFVVEVTDAAMPDDVVAYNAAVTDDGANGADLNPADNTASDTTVVIEQPDLTVAIDDDVDELRGGEHVTVAVAVANAGRVDASGVVLSVRVTGPVTVTSASDAGTFRALTGGGFEVSWPRFDLAVGVRTNRTFTVVIDEDARGGAGIVYVATVADDGSRGADLTPADNTASNPTGVVARAEPSSSASSTPSATPSRTPSSSPSPSQSQPVTPYSAPATTPPVSVTPTTAAPPLTETVEPTPPPALSKTGAPQVPLAVALSTLLLALGLILATRRRSHLEGR
ncbi:MAG: DUF11 domain-containing protein, partial [Bifidobacteriaceae bacterium]|jgi:hypothetical protein|nr:DUF11 domain-containing protein [Bifidobacteriaceae bacterium]